MRTALVIGIDKYPNAPLNCCVNDASAFSALLEMNEDNTRNFDVRLSTNIPRKADMMGAIKELFTHRSETALFYFSGHGFVNELGGYLVSPDASMHSEGVSMDDILILANESPADNKIIILDCCNAGAMGVPQLTGNLMTQIKDGVTILCASLNNEQAFELNKHGIFTGLLLDALAGGAADLGGHITPGSVYGFVDKALGSWSQRPVFRTNITRFTTLRTVKPPIAIDILRKIREYFPLTDHAFGLDPEYEYTYRGSRQEKIDVFKHLQKFERVGLVRPDGEEYMYWAALKSRSCSLTALGSYYWRLINDKRI
jgi:uncharacterized caspase-like protein